VAPPGFEPATPTYPETDTLTTPPPRPHTKPVDSTLNMYVYVEYALTKYLLTTCLPIHLFFAGTISTVMHFSGQCKKGLSSTNYNEFNGDLICSPCYKRHTSLAAGSVSAGGSFTASVGGITQPGFAAALRHRGSLGNDLDEFASSSQQVRKRWEILPQL